MVERVFYTRQSFRIVLVIFHLLKRKTSALLHLTPSNLIWHHICCYSSKFNANSNEFAIIHCTLRFTNCKYCIRALFIEPWVPKESRIWCEQILWHIFKLDVSHLNKVIQYNKILVLLLWLFQLYIQQMCIQFLCVRRTCLKDWTYSKHSQRSNEHNIYSVCEIMRSWIFFFNWIIMFHWKPSVTALTHAWTQAVPILHTCDSIMRESEWKRKKINIDCVQLNC